MKTMLDSTTIELAIAIADDAARSDIECLALADTDTHGRPIYDVSLAAWGADQRNLDTVKRAARYIERRGDALPYIMHREGDVVRFEVRV